MAEEEEKPAEVKPDLEQRIVVLEDIVKQLITVVQQKSQQPQGSLDPNLIALISKLAGGSEEKSENPFEEIGKMAVDSFMKTMIRSKSKHLP